MMWHWNSLWAPAPGDPPAIDDPMLWRAPWTAEQAIALQARSWEAALSATHSWWTMMLAAWPAGAASWPALPAWNPRQSSPETTADDTSPRRAEAPVEKAAAQAAATPTRKRAAASKTRKR